MTGIQSRLSAALADHYRIERELGQGGMATVYLAEDLKHKRKVAIKVLKAELGAVLGPERFVNEIRTTANLQHPNLLPLFDSGEADGFLYYVMPYVEGETLRARMDAERQLPVEETVRLVALLAGALDFAHARHVVHRDLKPENILLQAGQPIIADFGIALAVAQAGGERVTQTGLSLGTPHYMSPEQAAGTHTVDARSDQYALGATIYEMLTGEPPHTGPTTPAIVARLMTERPRDIRATRPAVPPGVDAAVHRALEKSPADRFPSCGAFAEALAAGLRAPATTPAATPNATPQAAGGGARRRAVGAVLALIVVASIVGAVMKWGASPGDSPGAATTVDERSLVVLPFTSVGGDTANSYFAAGIADELTSALMQIPGLRLAGRASAARVKEQGGGARAIGEALNVAAVLDGSVRRSGDRIRVSAELTSAGDERVIWSQTYERSLADVFAVQDEITREIVGALQLRLVSAGGASGMSARGGTTNLEAYDLYLRARPLFLARGTSLPQAERYLLEAIALDPGYARAHAMLASVLFVQPYYIISLRARDVAQRGRAAARRAIALDDSLAEGHIALGHAHSEAGEWSDAIREFERAIALDPQSAQARFRLGEVIYRTGRIREALEQFERALQLDPFDANSAGYVSLCLAMVGRTDEAIAAADRALALEPEHITVNAWVAVVLDQAGRHADAANRARRVLTLVDNTPSRTGLMAWILNRAGARGEAEALVRRLEALPDGTPAREVALIWARVAVDDLEGAFETLATATRVSPEHVAGFGMALPVLDPLRADPRFFAVLRQLDLEVARLTLPDGGRSQ